MRIMVPNKQKTCQSAICSLKFLSRVSSLVKNSHCAHTRRPKRAIERFRETKKSLRSPFLIYCVCALQAFLTHMYNMHARKVPSGFLYFEIAERLSQRHTCSDSCPNMDQKIAAFRSYILCDAHKCRLVLLSVLVSYSVAADTANAMCFSSEN
jgi:hypothetical protein